MTFVLDMIKGVLIGIANIIPGVSGGTMAVSLGIYDKLIASVSGLLTDWKKSFHTLLPIGLGCAIGIVGFTYAVEYLLSHYPFLTCMAFTGLILGGVPILVRSLKEELHRRSSRIGIPGILAFVLLFAVAVLLPLMRTDDEVRKTFLATPGTMASLFLVGVIASATMVVPGISGSLVMMILGYYYGVINTIKSFLDSLASLDMAGLIHGFSLLTPFGIGVLLGIFLIAKLITFLFERFGVETYCAILGLLAASPFAIFSNTPGVFGPGQAVGLLPVSLGLLLAGGFGVLTYRLGA